MMAGARATSFTQGVQFPREEGRLHHRESKSVGPRRTGTTRFEAPRSLAPAITVMRIALINKPF